MTLELVIATLNPAKAVRLRSLCDGLDVRFREVNGPQPTIDEASPTHLGNAIAKAIGWSRALGGNAMASDGGMVIPELGDAWESTLTHRATGENIVDSERARRLLGRMRDLSGAQRGAYWAEAIAVAREGVLVCAWGTDGMLGRVGETFRADPDGTEGFWADGLWEAPDGKKRWEISNTERANGADPWMQLFSPVNSFLARMT